MKKTYCTQNNGDCKTCSLVNYGRDCQDNPIRGGTRPGAGRPLVGGEPRKPRAIRLTDAELEQVKEFLKTIR